MSNFRRGSQGIGCGFNRVTISKTIVKKDEVCPICNSVVARGDKELVTLNGQQYHLYELLDLRHRHNGQKELFSKLSNYFKLLRQLEIKDQLQADELEILRQIFHPKSN